jgi:hypothetical protein
MTRWGTRLALAPAVVMVALVGAGPALGAGPGSSPAPGFRVDRTITDKRVDESSGLIVSGRRSGLLWTQEDSDNPATIYGIGADGRTAATYRLTNVQNTDWEAIAALRGPDGGPWIAIGDIGDNRAARKEITVALLPEPASLGDHKGKASYRLHLRYPADDGAQDAETLLADPRDGRLYIVTKGLLGGRLYAVPASAWPHPAAPSSVDQPRVTLQPMASIPLPLVTDGAVAPDGRLVLRTYQVIATLPPPEQDSNGTATTLAVETLPRQDQGESLALLPGTSQALVGSEGRAEPVYRVDVPGQPLPARAGNSGQGGTLTDSGASKLAAEAAAGAETRKGAGKQKGDDQNSAVIEAAIGAGAIGALLAAWFGLNRQFRAWSQRRRRAAEEEIQLRRELSDPPPDGPQNGADQP